MFKFFNYNSHTGTIELNKEELLVLNEFEALLDTERNRCKQDPEGIYKLRAFREFKYIYLMIDWASPIADWPEQKRHSLAMSQAELTEKEFNDETFRSACRRYQELKEQTRAYKLLESAYKTIDNLTFYFTNLVDFTKTNDETGTLLYKAKDVMAEVKNVGAVLDAVVDAENRYKKELEKQKAFKGDAEPGFLDING